MPVTLVRHRDTPLDGTAPALLYGYGAYEAVYPDQEWDPALPSLLDRGVVYAHAHVRGGGEGGRRWWLRRAGSSTSRTPSPTTPRSPTGWPTGSSTAPGSPPAGSAPAGCCRARCSASGPDRWRAVVAEVPFVDVVTTMFDASIPLTVTEWDEWGDPRRREEFDWLLAYSPYDNPPQRSPSRPARHRGAARPARDGVRARQVGRPRCARPIPSGLPAACSAARRAPAPTSAPRVGSPTSPTRPRSMPGSSTGSPDLVLLTLRVSND